MLDIILNMVFLYPSIGHNSNYVWHSIFGIVN